jgi:hypothetical protein
MGRQSSQSDKPRSLFELDQTEFPSDECLAPPPKESVWLGEQLPLFEGQIPIRGELQEALRRAEYEEAQRVLRRLEETYGPDEETERLGFLHTLDVKIWEETTDISRRLTIWRGIESRLSDSPPNRRILRNGFFERLFTKHSPQEAVRRDPEIVEDVIQTLYDLGKGVEARTLVRDALLAGHPFGPVDFEDEKISELLSEDLTPQWMASLGSMRHLWPQARPSEDDVSAFTRELSNPDPTDETERALAFWRAFCVAQLGRSIQERILLEARKRMKKLHPGLHAEYMGGTRLFE